MAAFPVPRVSVLIPNFNNGQQASVDGRRNFIADLLQSLWDTLHDDPTPVEILVYDDGSTDDGLTTLRQWSRRTWRDGQPVLTLFEDRHCGVLSRTANILSRAARGDILARLDGDTICLTRHWASRLVQRFDGGPADLGVIGPKQLRVDLKIHAYGDFILHPHGYIHVAAGWPRDAVQHPLEVDHVMGCFYCCRKQVYEELGGYDEAFLRGQTIDLGLRARHAGWRAIAIPDIEYVHAHGLRKNRETEADKPSGIAKTIDVFRRKWGFDRIAPDLEEVARRYAGTPLLWNPLVFGDQAWKPASRPDAPAAALTGSDWARFTQEPAVPSRINLRGQVISDIIRQTRMPRLAAIVGCGDGLLTHLLANQGVPCVGLDDRAPLVKLARQITGQQKYPQATPRFELLSDATRLPLADGVADLVLIDGFMDRHVNPVGVLREAWRVAAPGSLLAIVQQRQQAATFDVSAPGGLERWMAERRYTWGLLLNQIGSSGWWEPAMDVGKDDPRRDLVLIARRRDGAAARMVA